MRDAAIELEKRREEVAELTKQLEEERRYSECMRNQLEALHKLYEERYQDA